MLSSSGALLDPPTGKRSDRSRGNITAAFHLVGSSLLAAAAKHGQRSAATAAVQVFREATKACPGDPSLHNGLGASLLSLVRFESHVVALEALTEAASQFEAALAAAKAQMSPRAVCLRYSINLATSLRTRGERTGDDTLVERALVDLRSAAAGLPTSSVLFAYVQDHLGSTLMALGRSAEARHSFETALAARQTAQARARTWNNLGTVHAALHRWTEACKYYRQSLLLHSREHDPLAWALTQHNLASAILQRVLSDSRRPHDEVDRLKTAIEGFQTALQVRQRAQTPLDWAVTTANAAGAVLALGTHLCAGATERQAGLGHIRHALDLYKEALPELPPADLTKTLHNMLIALELLDKLSGSEAGRAEIETWRRDLRCLAAAKGCGEIAGQIGSIVGDPTRVSARSPAGHAWPTDIYSRAHKDRKEDIVQFLTRVWLPWIQAGTIDLPTLRAHDPSAAKAIDNFRQRRDPTTGQRRRLPTYLDIPTKREVNDRLAASIARAGDRPARLDWALRSRARREKGKL
jgi:tetratricopeptide (TPR) repeat protein